MIWLVAAAFADEPAEADATPPAEDPLPSALDAPPPADEDDGGGAALDALLQEAGLDPMLSALGDPTPVGEWFVRPTLALLVAEGQAPLWGGVEAGRRWFQVTETGGLSAEIRASALFPFAAARGRELRLGPSAGARWHAVGVRLGVDGAGSELHLDDAELAEAWGIAAVPMLTLDVWRIHAWGGPEATWWLTPDRAPAPEALLGDELAWRAGAAVDLRPIALRADVARRDTAIGPLWWIGGGLKVTLF